MPTTTITPTHIPALKIPAIASQLESVILNASSVAITTFVFMYSVCFIKQEALKK